MRDTSLVFPVNDRGEILLGHKRRGMGFGKWNGFGGKIEKGENMRECAARELFEESGLIADPKDFQLVADIYFDCPSNPEWSHGGEVYFVTKWQGNPHVSDEMEPKWFSLENLPYDEMWQADCHWIPLILSGKIIRGRITFAADGDTVTDYHFEEAILNDK